MPGDLQQTFNEAVALHKAGRMHDAERMYRELVRVEPRHSDALHLLGILELQSGRPHEAIGHIEQAIAVSVKPVAEFHTNVAAAHRSVGNLDRAFHHMKAAAMLKPADAAVHMRVGLIAMEKGAYADAAAYFGNATAINPNFIEAHANLGAALKQAGRLNDALRALRTALKLQPRDAGAHYTLGVVQKDLGLIKEAIESFAHAAAIDPQHAGAQWNLALGHLLLGEYAQGWETFDWYTRIKGAGAQTFAQPAWDGSELTGKTILLYEEHGYGDTLQFVRYARQLNARGARVVVSCRPEMVRLLSSAVGVDVADSSATPPPFDVHASFFALPKLMRTDGGSIPAEVPYLFPQADLVARWMSRGVLKQGRNAGLVWRGNKNTDARRAMTAVQAVRIAGVTGFNWVSLQVGTDAAEAQILADAGVADLGGQLSDWADTAALISMLDIVVTVDTAVAHLAGALGKTVWIMVPFVPDWRWLLDRADSPWYPTARLFRQPQSGWDGAVDDLCGALAAF